jgi:glycosyltransferase involved in cell wall biosynthesis
MTRSVWIDARPAQDYDQGLRGIGRYVLEHTRALIANHSDDIAGVVFDRSQPLPDRLQWLADTGKLRDFDDTHDSPPGLYHVMSPFEPLVPYKLLCPATARQPHSRLIATVYDLIPKVLPEYALSGGRRTRYEARIRLLTRADHILAISQATAADVERFAHVPSNRVTVIDAGVTSTLDTTMTVTQASSVLADRFPGLHRGFPLYVGGADPRKNLERLVRAWAAIDPAIRAGRPMVICGHAPADRVDALDAEAHAAGLQSGELIQTGYVSDRELAALYVSSGVFVFPSLYEGFGMPVLEAMAFGIPVVAAAASTTPEILADDELTFDPHDVHHMAAAIARALIDDEARARLKARSRQRSAHYSWAEVAERTMEAYEQALARPALSRAR